jgi:hypothetical protein
MKNDTIPTSTNDVQRINTLFLRIERPMVNLAQRWLDERYTESLNDYARTISPLLPPGFKLIGMTSRPFGFTFSLETGFVYWIRVSFTGRKCNYVWDRRV